MRKTSWVGQKVIKNSEFNLRWRKLRFFNVAFFRLQIWEPQMTTPPSQNWNFSRRTFFFWNSAWSPQITPRTGNARGELSNLDLLMENSDIAKTSLFTGRLPSCSSIDWYIQSHTVFSWTNIYRSYDRDVPYGRSHGSSREYPSLQNGSDSNRDVPYGRSHGSSREYPSLQNGSDSNRTPSMLRCISMKHILSISCSFLGKVDKSECCAGLYLNIYITFNQSNLQCFTALLIVSIFKMK